MPNENSKTITSGTFAGQGAQWQQKLAYFFTKLIQQSQTFWPHSELCSTADMAASTKQNI